MVKLSTFWSVLGGVVVGDPLSAVQIDVFPKVFRILGLKKDEYNGA